MCLPHFDEFDLHQLSLQYWINALTWFGTKKFGQKLPFSDNFWPKFFVPNLSEMKILLCKWHMAKISYFIKFFGLLLKILTKLQNRRFFEFIPFGMNETFSFYHIGMGLWNGNSVILRYFRLELLSFRRPVMRLCQY